MHLQLLGGLALDHGGTPVELGGPKQRTLLAALVAEAGTTLSVGRLVEVLWGEEPPASAEASLHSYVSNLRRALEPGRPPRSTSTVLVTRPGGYAIELPPDTLDADRFVRLVDAARDARRVERTDDSLELYGRALAIWATPWPEFEHQDFATGLRLRLLDLHAAAVEELHEVLLDLGQHRDVIDRLEAAVAQEPLREHRWYQLALARYRAGQQTDALRAIARARAAVADRAGLDLGPELSRLEADVLAQSPMLELVPLARATTPTRPSAEMRPANDAGSDGTRRTGPVFVGRVDELRTLLDALDVASTGTGRVVVVSGEPGIGKSRLCEEMVAVAQGRGIGVVWTHCPEHAAAAPLWPIRRIAAALAEEGVSTIDADDVPVDEPDLVGDEFVRSVRSLAGTTQPFVAVIDDFQWADASTLRVIEHGAADLRDLPVLLVVTVRPTSQEVPAALSDCLGELARQPGATRLSLSGLQRDEIGGWIADRVRRPPAGDIVDFVHDRTSGNPFFAQELIELLHTEDRLAGDLGPREQASGVPEAVADVIRRRVGQLPARSQRLLPVAAVVGRSFDADVVAAVAERSTVEVLEDLDPAVLSGLVVEVPDRIGRFTFSHALVAETLVAELPASRRTRLHAAAALALDELRGTWLDEHLAQIAHHALAGAMAGTADLALRCSTLAATRATEVGAREDASEHRTNVLRALELARPTDRVERHRALVAAGIARRSCDQAAAATAAFAEAIAVAEQLGDTDAMTRAAVHLNEPTPWQSGDYGAANTEEIALVERVLDQLPPGDSAVRAELTGALASYLYYRDARRCDRLSLEAVDMARRLGEPTTLARTLNNRTHALWRARTADDRRHAADELVRVVERHHLDDDLEFLARLTRVTAGMEIGEDPTEPLRRLRQLAISTGSSRALNQLGWLETAVLAVQGHHRLADAVAEQTAERYRRTRRWGAGPIHFGFVILSRLDGGQGAATLEAATTMDLGHYRAAFAGFSAWAATEIGRPDLARAALGAAGTVPDLDDDWLWLAATSLTALAVAELHDADAAAQLLDRLVPFSGRLAVGGTNPTACATDHAIGRLHGVLGDVGAAIEHLDRAVELTTSIGFTAWSTRARLDRAVLLSASGTRAAIRRADEDVTIARRDAERLDLQPVLQRLDRLGH